MLQARVTVFPDVGGFGPDSFRDLLQRLIHLPGLDPAWTHTLVDVEVAPDGGSAELTVHSEPAVALDLDVSLRVLQGVPPARVRVHDPAGTVLAEVALPAPLQPGQHVEIAGRAHVVDGEPTWPGRHPVHGYCAGDLDWQHVTVTPLPDVPHLPTLAEETPS